MASLNQNGVVPPNDVPIVQLPLSYPGFDGNSAASTAKISLATGIPFSSFEDDLFGSDTTLTSPEDDSEDEEQRSIQLSTTASVVPERPIGGTRVSLMARIIDAKVSQRVLDDDDSELSDDAEVQLGKQTEAPLTASMAAQECQSDFVQANGSAPDSDHSLERTDQTSVVTSTSDHVSAPTSSKLALPSTEAKDHVFAVPTAAARRAVRSSARARSFTDRRYSHRRPVSRQNYTRPILRHMPRPRLHQTCLEIVIDAGYSLKNEPDTSVASGTISERWTAVRDDALDHLSRRVGCEYCRKTFRNRNGLIAHTGRCTMARLQTSISSDMDESTASETEEQRKARCPKASYGKSSSSQDEYDDEDAVIMCLCGSKEDEGAMIQCDKCKVWLHMECVNLSEEDVPEEYFCPMCLGLPTPSTAGKSFRPTTKANPRRSDLLRHQSRSDDSGSDSDDLDVDVVRHNARRPRSAPNKIVLSYESSGLDDDDTDDEDSILEEVNGGLGSPQVVLNHSLSDIEDGEYLDDDECMAVCGVKLTRALKQRRAPGLMLDGSSSQEVQPEGTFLSGDLGHCDNSLLVFQQLGALELSPMKMDSDSGVDLSFHRSQSMEFLVSAETLFDPEYKSFDGYKSFEEYSSDLLLSESTLESDGLQTPVDLPHSGDLWIAHDLDSFVEETPEGFLKDV
ncbi:hypothetical protein BGX31_008342 [Mortierella sp. GBA43]|nr:hypothetical protein BGX31_008342 [Mortierella sp. GBA43]